MSGARRDGVDSPTFCVMPWVHLFADEQGQMRPCCMTLDDRARTNRDASGAPYRVGDPRGLDEAWNSPFMREIRRDMLEGRRPEVCSRCWKDEDLAIRSYRQDANAMLGAHAGEAVAATTPEGASPLPFIRSVDLRLGNVCNLRCRMCSPVSSKRLIPEWKRLFDVPDDDPRMAELQKVDWFDRDEVWRNLEPFLRSLDKLHFAGGEPLLIARMFDFLARVIESGRAPQVVLSYVTNLTTLPPRVRELWPAFRQVKLTVSLDGFGPLNTFIRHPSQWDLIDRHLTELTHNRAEYNCSTITVNTTVQAYNVLRLDALFEYLFTKAAPNLIPYPRLTLLYWPSSFSVRVLPADLKDLAEARLRAFVARWEGRWPLDGPELDRFLAGIEGVIAHMREEDRTEEIPELVRRSGFFDQSRGERTQDVLPELAPLFQPA